MFTTRDFLRQHPETVAAFVPASLRGWRDYLNDPDAAHNVIAKRNPALNPEWIRFSWQALRDGGFISGDDPSGNQVGQMTAERWTTMYNQLFDLKVIDKAFDPAAGLFAAIRDEEVTFLIDAPYLGLDRMKKARNEPKELVVLPSRSYAHCSSPNESFVEQSTSSSDQYPTLAPELQPAKSFGTDTMYIAAPLCS
jgi:hypothetical protein